MCIGNSSFGLLFTPWARARDEIETFICMPSGVMRNPLGVGISEISVRTQLIDKP